MDKKKKTILIVAVSVIALVIIITLIVAMANSNNNAKQPEENKNSKTIDFCENLKEKGEYSFSLTLDDQNKIDYVKSDNSAYIDSIYDGEETKNIIKNGTTYLLKDAQKTYYSYQNNETDLYKIENQLEELNDMNFKTGKESINGKRYSYEEYSVETEFLFKYFEDSELKNVKTRFYYDNDKLVYVKTIVGDYQELLKVETSNNVDKNLLELPSDYNEG